MTMPTPEKIDAYAERLLEAARAMVADPNSMEVRKTYMRRTFNLDWTAAAIVKLAGQEGSAEGDGGDGVPVHSLSVQAEPISSPPPTVGVEELALIIRDAWRNSYEDTRSDAAREAAQAILHRLQGGEG